ncbi:MAG: hypothetical protein FD170_3660 [Bacteroidetes bacterium]|nr:MAG: hypothetical protein FD170_3660 [Bacteroidota bacterium]
MLRKLLFIIALLSSFATVDAQKQANFWYFGENAGLNFSLGSPAPLTNGALSTWEGCSSISTSEGVLEFYTDGRFVYNKNHTQMPNGFGLNGNSSSTQSGIIVPKPGSDTEYYIFTVDAADNGLADGLCYTKVDMTLNGELGDVVTTEKNISLVPLACEKVTAVGHADGQTFWVITKKWGNADYYAYRITYDGVETTPVISTTGPPLFGSIGNDSKGYLKVSPDGTKIASANNTKFTVDISNFNNSTGVVSHLVTDNSFTEPQGFDPGGPYGVEFSPNSKYLYIGEWKANRQISQYDLTSGDPATILESKEVVATVGQGADPIGALQLGPDNRLYIARNQSGYISRINYPNILGTFCGFQENAVNLAGRQCRYGLPPFIQSFFYLSADFYWDEPACFGTPTQFTTSASDNPDSVKWTFPDGSTSTLLNPTYLFPSTGMYGVSLVVYLYGQSKNVSRFILIHPSTEVFIGNDSTICASEAFFLDAGAHSSYFWQDSSTSQTILGDTTGWYSCLVSNQWGCTAIDSLYLTVNPNPDISAGPEQSIPEGTAATLQGSVTGGSGSYTYRWEPAALLINPNVLQPVTFPMTTTTLFSLTVTDNQTGCVSEDDVLIIVPLGVLSCTSAADPASVCIGGQSTLNVLAYGGTGQYSYQWSSNPPGLNSTSANPVVAPGQTTTYTVTVNDGENIVTSSVTVTVIPPPLPYAGLNQVITYGTPTTLQGSVTQGSGFYAYQWAPADKLNFANIANPTTVNLYDNVIFSLNVTDIWTGCVNEQASFVSITLDGVALNTSPNAHPDTVCYGQTLQLFSLAGGGTQNYTYSWTSNPPGFTSTAAQPEATPLTTTVYTVVVNDGFNSATGQVTVTVNPLPVINLMPLNDPYVPISPIEIGVCVFDTVTIDAGNPVALYLWSNGETSRSIDVLSSGIISDSRQYSVNVTNPVNGCENSADITVVFKFDYCSYGISEMESDDRLVVFPNPSTDGSFNYTINGLKGETLLEVYTIDGLKVMDEHLNLLPGERKSASFDLNRAAGIYLLKLSNKDAVILKRIIKQ